MASIDSNKVTNVEVQNEKDISSSKVIPTNNDQNPNTSTIAKVDEETMVSSDLFAYNPALYSFCKEKSIVNILKVGEAGTLEFQAEIRNGVYGITLWPECAEYDYDKFLEEIAITIPEATQWSNRRPNIGDLVFGKRVDGNWIRGYVISVLPYLKIAVMDEARVVMATHLATCGKPLSDLYAFCGICELTDTTHKFKEREVFQFTVTGHTGNDEQEGFEILILKRDFELKATVKPWIPMPEQLGIPCADVTNGSEVCVSGYRNHRHLYVRPLDTQGLARYNYVMQTVAKCAETSPFLKGPPPVAHKVLAQSADGNYYRATVARVEEDGSVEVMYHDLGCTEYVNKEKLKIFPDYLKKFGYSMSKVELRDVPPDIPPLKSIIDILDNLVETKVRLLCTFDGVPSTEGVYLKYPDGGSVNNAIRKCLNLEPMEAAE